MHQPICDSPLKPHYYSQKLGPVVCVWCGHDLPDECQRQLNDYRKTYGRVLPSCGSPECVTLSKKKCVKGWSAKGWILRWPKVTAPKTNSALKRKAQKNAIAERLAKRIRVSEPSVGSSPVCSFDNLSSAVASATEWTQPWLAANIRFWRVLRSGELS